MNEKNKILIALECGMAIGTDEENKVEYIGTDKQWNNFDKLINN